MSAKRIFAVETEYRKDGSWTSDETFQVLATTAINAAQRVNRKVKRQWNNVRVREVRYVGELNL